MDEGAAFGSIVFDSRAFQTTGCMIQEHNNQAA